MMQAIFLDVLAFCFRIFFFFLILAVGNYTTNNLFGMFLFDVTVK